MNVLSARSWARIAVALSALMAGFAPLPAPAYGCPFPGAFQEGHVHGLWVGVVLGFNGEPGGPHAATLYTMAASPSGDLVLKTLGTIHAKGEGAAELRAMFVGDRLYLVNNRYPPGSTDKEYEYFEVRRFRIDVDQKELVPEGEGAVNLSRLPVAAMEPSFHPCGEEDSLDKALRKEIEAGRLDQLWVPQ
jgi:hypothetical protein